MNIYKSLRISALFLVVSCVALGLTAAAICHADTTTMRYKFTAGQVITYKSSTDIDSTMVMSGQTIPLKQHIESMMTQTIQSVAADGTATIKSGISSMQMSTNGQPTTLPDDVMNKLAAGSSMTMTPTGKVKSLEMTDTSGGGLPGMDMTGSNPFGQMALLPDHPVNVGDSWRATVPIAQIGADMAVSMKLSQILKDSGASIAEIGTKYYAATKPGGSTIEGAPMKMDMLLNGTGTTDFDIDAGNVKSTVANMTMKMTMAPPSTGAQPQTIHVDMTMVMHLDRQDGVVAPPSAPAIPPTPGTPPTPTAPSSPAAPPTTMN